MKRIWTDEMIAYLRSIAKGNWTEEIRQMVNDKFGTNFSRGAIKAAMGNYGVTNGMLHQYKPQPWNRLTTPEQDKFILEHYKMTPNKELARLVNEEFGTNFTAEQMDAYKSRNHLDSGLTGYFPKGHTSWNKGKKMSPEVYAKAAPTMFKKGTVPPNWKPVGSERISKDGYVEIKVENHKPFVLKHRWIWEQHNGPIPKYNRVIFLNGDKTDCRIENLACVTRQEAIEMTRHKMFSKNPEATKTGVLVAKMISVANDLKKEN